MSNQNRINLEDLNERMVVRITELTDDNPLKATVHNYKVKRGSSGDLYLSYHSRDTNSYNDFEFKPKLTQALLDDPKLKVEAYDFYKGNELISHEHSMRCELRRLSFNNRLHTSNFFKFDIDGKEQAGPGRTFTEINNMPLRKQSGSLQEHLINQLHRPQPLRIGKFENPPTLLMKSGSTVQITHVTELGELVYSAKGLKSVDKSLADPESLNKLIDNIGFKHHLAPALEDSLVGDIPQYRQSFLDLHKGRSISYSI